MTSGAVSFSSYMRACLYDPSRGFYTTGGSAGRRADFVTSPEVGPLFGALLARALDGYWRDLGCPDPFFVHEHGAGPGTLARTVFIAKPDCGAALRWVLIEISDEQRLTHHKLLADRVEADIWTKRGEGPMAVSVAAAPNELCHVVVANELLDNLCFDVAIRTTEGWSEALVVGWPTTADHEPDLGWADERGVLPVETCRQLDLLAADLSVGARVPVQSEAQSWLLGARRSLLPGGRLLVFDYGFPTAELALRGDWLRTYCGHERGDDPFMAPSQWDITTDVAIDQMIATLGAPLWSGSQAEALERWGIAELLAEADQAWKSGPALDVAGLRLRSRTAEAQVLMDNNGLGGFWVAEWSAG